MMGLLLDAVWVNTLWSFTACDGTFWPEGKGEKPLERVRRMRIETIHPLRAVHGDAGDWQGVQEELHSGRNFFLILPAEPDAVQRFCESFGLQADCLSKPIRRSDFLRMSQHVDGPAFNEVLQAMDAGFQVIFLEQLDFPINRPPHVKPFLVYSTTLGILEQHDNIREARKALGIIEHSWMDRSSPCQPALYQWNGRKWMLLDD